MKNVAPVNMMIKIWSGVRLYLLLEGVPMLTGTRAEAMVAARNGMQVSLVMRVM